jgi:hypothetical protein
MPLALQIVFAALLIAALAAIAFVLVSGWLKARKPIPPPPPPPSPPPLPVYPAMVKIHLKSGGIHRAPVGSHDHLEALKHDMVIEPGA